MAEEATRSPIAKVLLSAIFAHGVPAMIYVHSPALREGSGFPKDVLARFPRILPLALDPLVFDRMDVVLGRLDLRCYLSFDALYHVTIPYDAILRVSMDCCGEGIGVEEVEKEAEQTHSPPGLRLVLPDSAE